MADRQLSFQFNYLKNSFQILSNGTHVSAFNENLLYNVENSTKTNTFKSFVLLRIALLYLH